MTVSAAPSDISDAGGASDLSGLPGLDEGLQARVAELEAELDSFRERDRRTALVVWRPDHHQHRR